MAEPAALIVLPFFLQPAAGRFGRRRIHRFLAFLDERNLARHVHHESGAVGNARRHEDSIRLGNLALGEIAQHGETGAGLFAELPEAGNVVRAQAEDLRVVSFKFLDTSLVPFHFGRSTTGEGGGEKRQYDVLLSAEAG